MLSLSAIITIGKSPTPIALDTLIAKARLRMEVDTAKVKSDLMFNQTEITQHLNEDGSVASAKTELFLVYGAQQESSGLQLAKLLLEIDGQPVLAESKWMDGFIDETLFDRFQFGWTDKTTADCGGHQCYVVSFWPKQNPPYNSTHKQRTFNLLMGILYIEKDSFILRRGQARLSKPYNKVFGLGCRQLDISFEFTEYMGIEVSRSYLITTRLKAELFGSEEFKHHSIHNNGYRHRPSP